MGPFVGSWAVGIAYVALFTSENGKFHWMPALYVTAFFAAPFVNRLPSLAARLIARAFWFQSTFMYSLLGGYALYKASGRWESLLNGFTFHWEQIAVLAIWAGPILALFAAGTHGLDAKTQHFTPQRFRGTMLASLVFGAADFLALAFYGAVTLEKGLSSTTSEGVLLLASAGLMAAALFGLFRLRVWGLVLCVGANLLVAGLALSGTLGLPELLAGGLAATAAAQLLIPIPMVREILAGLRRARLSA